MLTVTEVETKIRRGKRKIMHLGYDLLRMQVQVSTLVLCAIAE